MTLVTGALGLIAGAAAVIRWLRVCQREHYLPGSCLRFAARWWSVPPNPLVAGIAFGGLIIAWLTDGATAVAGAGVAAGAVALGPIGLGLRGRTAPLAWTARLRRLAAIAAAVESTATLAGFAVKPALALVAAGLAPLWVDVAAWLATPIERRMGTRWVDEAAETLATVNPRVVAITGSYGKTTTKLAVAHLAGAVKATVASPASFNNRLGLARAINEGLTPGTEIFVAEMGTYGPGEIAELCSWIPPSVSVMTAIGPVHLERMGSEEAIVEAKREILAGDAVGVINVDHPLLAELAQTERSQGRTVITCSTRRRDAEVFVDPETGSVSVADRRIGAIDPGSVHPGNAACSVGAIIGLGLDPEKVADRLPSIPVAPHRQTVTSSERGFQIIDDTFNANPAGAARALRLLAAANAAGRRVVVTPGMVELGSRQAAANAAFARDAVAVADHLIVVGRTNRRALLDGVGGTTSAQVIVAATRDEAVEWVRTNLGTGDVVLYENDLPDHYP